MIEAHRERRASGDRQFNGPYARAQHGAANVRDFHFPQTVHSAMPGTKHALLSFFPVRKGTVLVVARKDVLEFAKMLNPKEGEVLFFTTEQMRLYPRRPEGHDLQFGRYPAFACRRHKGVVEVLDVGSDDGRLPIQPVWAHDER